MKFLIHTILIQSWWVIAFALLCGVLYEQGLRQREGQYSQLKNQYAVLQTEKRLLLERQEQLLLEVNSQSDLAWLELTLKKGLGLVPENEKKVYFY